MISGQLADHRSAATEEPLELSELITSAVPQATKNKVQWAYRVFLSWVSYSTKRTIKINHGTEGTRTFVFNISGGQVNFKEHVYLCLTYLVGK